MNYENAEILMLLARWCLLREEQDSVIRKKQRQQDSSERERDLMNDLLEDTTHSAKRQS